MKCVVCGKEFDGRSDARFCSSTCRSRRNRATDNGISVAKGVDATDNGGSATDNCVCATDNATDIDIPCRVVQQIIRDGYMDLEKDLKLSLQKDLGITAWTSEGVFIREDITIPQVRNIAKLIHAKHGRTAHFNEAVL